MGVQVIPWKLGAAQSVAYTSSQGASTAVGKQTYAVMLCATSDCHIATGQGTPTAATTGAGSTFLPAKVPIVIGVAPGDAIAAIQDSANGTLFVTELTH